MPILHMTIWTVFVIVILAFWRLRNWREVATVAVISGIILLFSQVMFLELTSAAGMDPARLLSDNSAVLHAGPFGLLAVLVLPLGWLGPIIGAGLVNRWQMVGETVR